MMKNSATVVTKFTERPKSEFLPIFQGNLCRRESLQTSVIFENFATLPNHANHCEMIYNETEDFSSEFL